MLIKKIDLKGFTGIQKGLGLPALSITLPDSGLIAISGPNGAGKTTTLDNLHPYPTLASRDGSLARHVATRDAERTIELEHDSHQYKIQIKVDAQSGRSEGFIWRDGEPLTDGKISAFKKTVEQIFGSPDLFFQSVFSSQGGAKLTDLQPAELKALFAEFLRLDRYAAWEATAKQALNLLGAKLGQVNREIDRLNERIAALTPGENEINEVEGLIIGATERAREWQDVISALETAMAELNVQAKAQDAITAQAATLTKRRVDEAAAARKAADEGISALAVVRAKLNSVAVDIHAAKSALADRDRNSVV
jgi:exonuclease SbcC